MSNLKTQFDGIYQTISSQYAFKNDVTLPGFLSSTQASLVYATKTDTNVIVTSLSNLMSAGRSATVSGLYSSGDVNIPGKLWLGQGWEGGSGAIWACGYGGVQTPIFNTYYDLTQYGTTIMQNSNGSASFRIANNGTATMTCSNLVVSASTRFNGDITGANVIPKDDNYWNLGNSTSKFANAYVQNLYLGGSTTPMTKTYSFAGTSPGLSDTYTASLIDDAYLYVREYNTGLPSGTTVKTSYLKRPIVSADQDMEQL